MLLQSLPNSGRDLTADRPIVRVALRRLHPDCLHDAEGGGVRAVLYDGVDFRPGHAARSSAAGFAMCASQRGASPRLIGNIALTHSLIASVAVNRAQACRLGQYVSLQRSNSSISAPTHHQRGY